MNQTPSETIAALAAQVRRWYREGQRGRDKVVAQLQEAGQDEIAQEILRWFDQGNRRFEPLLQRMDEAAQEEDRDLKMAYIWRDRWKDLAKHQSRLLTAMERKLKEQNGSA